MQRDRLVRLNELHTLQGVVLGWILYFVCLTGSVAVLYHEIEIWEEPAARHDGWGGRQLRPLQYEFTSFVRSLGRPVDEIGVDLPTQSRAVYAFSATIEDGDERKRIVRHVNAVSGEELHERGGRGAAHWLRNLHRNLMTGNDLGRVLVGLTGVYMLVLLLSGVVVHRRILRDLFKMRWHQSNRLKWKDFHNALGLWTLPFGAVVSFSGIIVGIPPLMASLFILAALKGEANIEQLEGLFGGQEKRPAGVSAEMLNLDDAVEMVRRETGHHPYRVNVTFWEDAAARYEFRIGSHEHLINVSVVLHGVSGEFLAEESRVLGDRPDLLSGRVFFSMFPLHYGTFGGLGLKILYVVLGVALSISIVAGMLLYLEQRVKGSKGARGKAYYRVLSYVNSGLLAGLPIATLLSFYADRLLTDAADARLVAIGVTYLGAWLTSIVYCLYLRDARLSARQLMACSTALALALPLFDAVTNLAGFWTPAVMAVNGTVALAGVGLLTYLALSRKAEPTAVSPEIAAARD